MGAVFVFAERWPPDEFRGTEAAAVALGETGRSVPDEVGGVFEGFQTAQADVGFVGALGFVFTPFAGVVGDGVI